MNCNDYLAMLATLPVDELTYGPAREHALACRDCDRVTRVVAERERNMLRAYDALHSSAPVGQTALRAIEASRRRRVVRYYEIAVGIAMAAGLVSFVAVRRSPARVPVAMVSETFRLQCLSPGQAVELLRPYRSTSAVTISSPSSLSIITVRAVPEEMQKLRSVIDRYDNPAQTRCAALVTVPKTP